MQLSAIITVIVCYGFGIYFYCRGFLLTRNTLLDKSKCSDVQHPGTLTNPNGCWVPARYEKAVIIIIDALRFDFVLPHNVNSSKYNPTFHNRLPVVHNALIKQHDNSLLAAFIADPPTTTLQRLKGLTTGSLPTFIDAGSNFAGSRVEEDNWIHQAVSQHMNITFMGDDTWTHLYPDQFARSYPFPSFDVKDLHTVDNGVLSHIYDELATDDWRIMIAHFLGVDHCGHKYGPNHPEMSKKLDQMNDMLGRLMAQLDDKTVLFVLGDHGMTDTGDHGGDSDYEVGSALFVYSKQKLHNSVVNILDDLSQIDLVPTLCLLLDIPVPYSNLGVFLPQLFFDDDLQKQVANANIGQVLRYAANYAQQLGSDAPLSQQLDPVVRVFNSLQPDEIDMQRCHATLHKIQNIFRLSWAKFHDGWMALGMIALIETVLWSLRILIDTSAFQTQRRFLKVISIVFGLVCMFARNESIPPFLGLLLVLQASLVAWDSTVVLNTYVFNISSLGWFVCSFVAFSPSTAVLTFAMVVMYSVSTLSNSYVVHADTVLRFVLGSQVTILFVAALQRCFDHLPSQLQSRPTHKIKAIKTFKQALRMYIPLDIGLPAMLCFVFIRISAVYWRCREEQAVCLPHWTTVAFGSLTDGNGLREMRYILAITCVIVWVAVSSWYLRRNGHLGNVYDGVGGIKALWMQFVPWVLQVCVSCVVLFWTAGWLPEVVLERYSVQLQLAPPLIVYACTAVHLVWHWCSPLLYHVTRPDATRSGTTRLTAEQAMDAQCIVKHVTTNWQTHFGGVARGDAADQTPTAFGLATVYTGSLIGLCELSVLSVCLLLGDGVTPALMQLMFVMIVCLALLARLSYRKDYLIIATCVWCGLSHYGFYWLSHQPTFNSIPWDAAFVGLPGNFRFQWVQAALVVINCETSCILFAFTVPLLVIWPAYNARFTKKTSTTDTSTEYDLLLDSSRTMRMCAHAAMMYVTLNACIAIGTTAASMIHRRHLMLWKIFAPNLVFAWISFGVSAVFTVLGLAFIANIHMHRPNLVVVKPQNNARTA